MTARPSRSYRRLLVLAGAALLWERLWPRLWPFIVIAGLFLAVALLDVLPRLPSWLHLGLLLVFAAAAVIALVRAVHGLRLPAPVECRRRLEQDSGLVHRPLTAMEDKLAAGTGDPLARSLWTLHQQRVSAAATRLAVSPPHPCVARVEPWGLRAGVVLLLTIAVAAAGASSGERLQRALSPAVTMAPGEGLSIEIWITPPAYTGVAPVLLAHRQPASAGTSPPDREPETPVTVPAGSKLLAQVSGVRGEPHLIVGDEEDDFVALANGDRAGAFRAEAILAGGDRLEVVRGLRTLARWPLKVVADKPPSAAFARQPEPAGNGALRLCYTTSDDYGVHALTAEIRRDLDVAQGGDPAAAQGSEEDDDLEVVRLDLSPPASAGGEIAGSATEDLSEHAWAGSPVRIRLVARDAIGQAGASDEAILVIPERSFRHPVAKAIAAERKRLIGAAPRELRAEVAAKLAEISQQPDAFNRNIVVSLSLAIASARLLNDAGAGAVASVRGLLWATALALDDGDIPRAEQALAEAREKLRQALESGAEAAEIEQLADALEQALNQYVNAIAGELAKRGGAVPPPVAADAMLGSDELRELVDMVRQMARTGARDGARELLDQLQAMLDGLRNGLDAAGDTAALAEASALMQALADLAAKQQGLLEQTFAKIREADNAPADLRPKGRPGVSRGTAGASAQTELRRELGALAERLRSFLSEPPGALSAADEAMGEAAGALRRDDLEGGSSAQGRALQALREAQQGAGQAMGKRLGGGVALFPGSGRGGDVFGRSPRGRGFGIGEVEIPAQGQLRRASEILEELRRRAGDRSRPEAELDYIERLLRRF